MKTIIKVHRYLSGLVSHGAEIEGVISELRIAGSVSAIDCIWEPDWATPPPLRSK